MRRLLLLVLAATTARAGYDAASVSGTWLIRGYKLFLSPPQGPNMCNFWPTCSQFTRAAIESHGLLPGMVIGADRLMRCNPFAWNYHDRFYLGTSHNRLSDPVANHIAWTEPPPAAERPRPISARVVSDSLLTSEPVPSLVFAEHLYACGNHAEAASEFLRVRFQAGSAELKDYAGLMAGESYLAGRNPDRALKAFDELTGSAVGSYASYGKARALFSQGLMPRTRQQLDSVAQPGLDRAAQYLAGWTWYREFDFSRGAGCYSRWRDDSIAALLADLGGQELSTRSRTLSTLLSSVVPGLGQVYSGRTGDGIYSFLTVASTGLITWWFVANSETKDRTHVKAAVFGSLTALFHIGNAYGANVAARDYNVMQKRRYLEQAERLLEQLALEPDYGLLRDSLEAAAGPAARE